MDCVQSDWKDWSSCEPYCDGVQSRIRKILVEVSWAPSLYKVEGSPPFCLLFVIFCASRLRMVVSHVVHPYSLESAITSAWIACGQTGWKPGVV